MGRYKHEQGVLSMRKFLLVGTCMVALCAFQVHASPKANAEDFNFGAIIGGLAGGVLGSQVGKGSGKLWATGAGAVLGTIVGTKINRADRYARAHSDHNYDYNRYYNQRANTTYSPCARIVNDGARAACERGVAERHQIAQRQAEQRAYECGRYGRCN